MTREVLVLLHTGRATNLRAEDIEKMPKGRDFTSLITQAAGANFETKSGGPRRTI